MSRAHRRHLLPAVPALLAGCLGAPSPPEPAGALRYHAEVPGPLVYVQADTAVLEIAAGGQAFEVDAQSASTWELAVEEAPDGLRVTATLTDLEARFENPLTGPRAADEAGVTGPVVFTLDPRGRAELVSAPTVEGVARELFSVAPVVHHLLPRLPGRAVQPGETWADTVRYTLDEPTGEVRARVALAYTAEGDTLVEGRPHLRVRYRGTDAREASGDAGGMAFSQTLEGPVEGVFLWDLGRGVLRALEQTSDLSGTMTVPMSPSPLDVRVRSRMRVALVDAVAGG